MCDKLATRILERLVAIEQHVMTNALAPGRTVIEQQRREKRAERAVALLSPEQR